MNTRAIRIVRYFATAACLVASAPNGALRAQTAQALSIQFSGLYQKIMVTKNEGMGNGPGAEIQLRYTAGALSIGVGGDYFHRTSEDGGDGSVNLVGVFLEPRYVFDIGSEAFAPYLSARAGIARGTESFDAVGAQESTTSTATVINGGGGVLTRLSARSNLDLGATYGTSMFKPGGGIRGTSQNLIFRVGFSFGLR
jgi:hypothetical protein